MDIDLLLALFVTILNIVTVLFMVAMPVLLVLACVYLYKRIRKDFN